MEQQIMSLLTVEQLSHTFGDRVLFRGVSFRLLAGEHVGLVGANGTGKSTMMNILTGKQLKDEGKVEWTPRVRYGYLDQHTKLEAGKTIRDVLKDAFAPLLVLEQELNEIALQMVDADPDTLEELLQRMGEIQEELEIGDFYRRQGGRNGRRAWLKRNRA
jgi:ATPase subunit of ABC transporter with duplicated ATPase domains